MSAFGKSAQAKSDKHNGRLPVHTTPVRNVLAGRTDAQHVEDFVATPVSVTVQETVWRLQLLAQTAYVCCDRLVLLDVSDEDKHLEARVRGEHVVDVLSASVGSVDENMREHTLSHDEVRSV